MRENSGAKVESYRQIVTHRHEYAWQWKARTGGKVVGSFCTYVPEEIIYASGMLPVRILGSHEPQDISDRHIFPTVWCAYCRDCLAQGLKGRYDYLDGIVYAWCCQHIAQAYSSWKRHIPMEFAYQIYVPTSLQRPSARECFISETTQFARALEGWTGRGLSGAALDRSIQVYDCNRRLMKEVYELRKKACPPISGAECMEMVIASMLMDKEEHNQLLAGTLQQLSGPDETDEKEKEEDSLPRLMLLGSENDDVHLVRFIESLGARVVIDEQCIGSRYFWGEARHGGPRLAAIANRYIDRPPCPQKDVTAPERRRLPHLLELAQDYHVEGVVIVQQKFCEPYRYEIPLIESAFRGRGIPSLVLEVEQTVPTGQFRTRIEAFLEVLYSA